ncbi:MAG: hypothetical protein AAF502_22435 [Bacteroidota bacterium]
MSWFPSFGLKEMLPEKPVISDKERKVLESTPSVPISTQQKPLVDFPVIPFQVFGMDYEKDIVIATRHPKWNLHEYAQVRLPEGPLWIMKDALEGSLDQFIAINREGLAELMPEIPLSISVQDATIIDRSTEKLLDISFEYQNHLGEKVHAAYKGKIRMSRMRKRNGSTMGHSKNQLLVVLDLSERRFGKKATIYYDGKIHKVKKLLGIKPFQMLVKQTQGGISTGDFQFESSGSDGLKSYHHSGKEIIQNWSVEANNKMISVRQENRLRTMIFNYQKENNHQRLSTASVQLWDRNHPAFQINFFPCLPDLRIPFDHIFKGNFVMDVNGQKNHAIGKIFVESNRKTTSIHIMPEKPWWLTDRPMKIEINYKDGMVSSITRIRSIS